MGYDFGWLEEIGIDINEGIGYTGGEDKYISSPVPGSVYNDLLMAGRMEDPYFRDNEMAALELMKM